MITVVDYEAGNLYNVGNALSHLGVQHRFSSDPEEVADSGAVILPGVGSARPAMQSLQDRKLVLTLKQLEVPFLGICLGLQLLFEQSAEDETPCLGLFQGVVTRLSSSYLKVPHMGWNEVQFADRTEAQSLFFGIPQHSFFYFVHSYYVVPSQPEVELASTEYGTVFTCAVQLGNFWGVQFHPERSGELGLQVLHNFVTRIAGIGC